MLAGEIATLAKRLATDIIPHDYISTLLACRLVPLKKKDNGIRPVGVGECLRRIIGKTITGLLKEDIIHAVIAGMCGLESSTEAAIHDVRKSFEEDSSECLLLVDVDNAFNKLNRKVSLEYIKRLCRPHVHIPTQQLQHTRHALSRKWWPYTVTRGCDASGQCSFGNVCSIHTTTDTSIEQRNCKWWKWNRYGMQMIALQSDHWQEWKNGGNTYRSMDHTLVLP